MLRILSVLLVLTSVSAPSPLLGQTSDSALPGAAAPDVPAPPAPPPPDPAEILARCQSALAAARPYTAELKLEVWYPSHYTSDIRFAASRSGDERAQMETRVRSDSFRSLEVLARGVLWTEHDTPQGKVVTRTDINKIRQALAERQSEFAPLPSHGAGALFDIAGLAELVSFTQLTEMSLEERPVFVLTGSLADKFAKGTARLPAPAAMFYQRASVYIDKNDSLPVRIDLGGDTAKPLLRLDFLKIDPNVGLPDAEFSYNVAPDAQLLDRTDAALSELAGQ